MAERAEDGGIRSACALVDNLHQAGVDPTEIEECLRGAARREGWDDRTVTQAVDHLAKIDGEYITYE